MDLSAVLLTALAVLVLLAVAARAFSAPLKLLLKAALNTVLGLAARCWSTPPPPLRASSWD